MRGLSFLCCKHGPHPARRKRRFALVALDLALAARLRLQQGQCLRAAR